MSTQTAFQRGAGPLLHLLLAGKEEAVLTAQPDRALLERIEQLAAKSTEGELTAEASTVALMTNPISASPASTAISTKVPT